MKDFSQTDATLLSYPGEPFLYENFFKKCPFLEKLTMRCFWISPFPPIASGPYPHLAEKVMENWKGKGGYLDEKDAIVDGSTGLKRSFSDYYNSTCGIAATLKYELGIEEGDTVCLFAPNHVDYLPVTLATTICGAKITPVNPLYKPEELHIILERSRSSVLVAHISTMEVALEAAKGCKYVKHIVIMRDFEESVPEGVLTLDSLKEHDKAFSSTIHDRHPDTNMHPCRTYPTFRSTPVMV